MCNLNVSCLSKDGSCQCSQAKLFTEIIRPVPIPVYAPNDSSYLSTLLKILVQQNELIKNIADQTKTIFERISKIPETSTQSVPGYGQEGEEVTTSKQLLNAIYGHDQTYSYSLQLLSEIPSPAYKERAFSLFLQIVNDKDEKVVLPDIHNFEVLLFSTESPPKAIKANTAGDKIFKGTTEAQGNSTVFFRKIAVKEVTSHFRNGCFFFVVHAKDSPDIKPLIIDNFVVKARKMTSEGAPKKRSKTDQGSGDSPSSVVS